MIPDYTPLSTIYICFKVKTVLKVGGGGGGWGGGGWGGGGGGGGRASL